MGKISDMITNLEEIHSKKVHEYDMVLGTFYGIVYNLTYMNAGDKNVKHHHEHYNGILCFVLGTGRVLEN